MAKFGGLKIWFFLWAAVKIVNILKTEKQKQPASLNKQYENYPYQNAQWFKILVEIDKNGTFSWNFENLLDKRFG